MSINFSFLKYSILSFSHNRYKFDHERVTKEDPKRVLEEQYGGVEELPQTNPGFNNTPFKFTKYSNAYTLVYIREVDKEKVICNVDEKDITNHADVDSFARGVGLVSLLGDKSDGDRKIEDLKLLY
ncbi:ubiquitin carboxyl-terminal hydrolase 13 [Trifolium repens]|nr:ubiquitin carboxyl-terminal hydrolase 13 [Trifolium repens]